MSRRSTRRIFLMQSALAGAGLGRAPSGSARASAGAEKLWIAIAGVRGFWV